MKTLYLVDCHQRTFSTPSHHRAKNKCMEQLISTELCFNWTIFLHCIENDFLLWFCCQYSQFYPSEYQRYDNTCAHDWTASSANIFNARQLLRFLGIWSSWILVQVRVKIEVIGHSSNVFKTIGFVKWHLPQNGSNCLNFGFLQT